MALDFDALLAPVSPEAPCGIDLSFSREFDAVREARREDDPTLAQGEWKKPLKVADWAGVAAQCEALLRQRSKDLRVAAWLTDALARTDGLAGLADGLTLCVRLCETFWDGLFPRPEGDDDAPRTGSLQWLLGQVVELSRVASAPVDGASSGERRVSERIAVERAIAALARLQAVVEPLLGDDGPAFSSARHALDRTLDEAARVAREAGAADAPGLVDTSAPQPGVAPLPAEPGVDNVGSLRTRDQALRQLRDVAEYFRRTEPHSPVAYLADKAAQWGEMPLHDWLRAVLKDPGALAQIEDVLGVAPSPMR